MILEGTVQQVNPNSLLIREAESNNEFLVNTSNTRRFSRGDCVRVVHSGQMTLSIPPQVSANSIQIVRCDSIRPPSPSRPAEMTAIVLQRGRNELFVRDIRNNRQVLVRTPHAHHFCRGQRIIITYDTIRMSNPLQIDARDIRANC